MVFRIFVSSTFKTLKLSAYYQRPAAGEKIGSLMDFGWQVGDFTIRLPKSQYDYQNLIKFSVVNQPHLGHASNFRFCSMGIN